MSEPRILPGCTTLPPLKLSTNGKGRATIGAGTDSKTGDKSKGKKKTGDRFAVLNAFADFTLSDLDRGEIAVWLLLYRDTKPDGLARTSQADLARRAGTSTRTVVRAIASLEHRGLLKIVYRGGLRQGVSTYRIRPLERERTR